MERILEFKPDESGFIQTWLTSGPAEEPYQTDYYNPNQLEFEKKLRGVIADGSMASVPPQIRLGADGLPGHPWSSYQAGNNLFVDFSKFYFLLTKVELYAASTLVSPVSKTVNARLWTFAAVEVWCNGEQIASVKEPVYKPITRRDLQLRLNEGRNEIFIRMQNLGVRDTRNIFGLQLLGDFADITTETPDFEHSYPIAAAERQFTHIRVSDMCLTLPEAPLFPITIEEIGTWDGTCSFSLPAGTERVTLSMNANGTVVKRNMEFTRNIRPSYIPSKTPEEHRRQCIELLSDANAAPGSEAALNSVFGSIAQHSFGKKDIELLRSALPAVDNCEDCADFKVLAILRVLLTVGGLVSEKEAEEFKRSLLNFRYWMDESGRDGMCFWSENHALCFYACQLTAGKLYPDEIFSRSGRTGKEQYALGNRRSREWLDSVETTGFEEFLSPGYMNVTMRALLALVDFAEDDVSRRAGKVLDMLLRTASMHVFDNVMIAPCGRIYHNVIRPHTQAFLSTLFYFNPDIAAGSVKDVGGYAPLLISGYKAPEDLTRLMEEETHKVYQTGNAEITLCKTKYYILTSAASERSEAFKGGWSSADYIKENPYETGNFSFMYVKSLNERYHGTTLFQPGVFGYQQHMWSAALSNVCNVMVNHPGATNQKSVMRPGYWYGNGLMPAIRQWDNVLGTVYQLDEKHPVSFTHLYFPIPNFDRTLQDGSWLFGQSKEGLIAIWCSAELKPFNDVLTDCEFRAYGKNQAYVCICSDTEAEGSFEQFAEACKSNPPRFYEEDMLLDAGKGRTLKFIPKSNDTQII